MTIKFKRGKQQFEIKRDQNRCVGYVDGVLSVTGPDAPTVTRVLLRKHVRGAPKAKVIPFDARPREQRAERVRENEPDLAG
jgi:hypothetical protein